MVNTIQETYNLQKVEEGAVVGNALGRTGNQMFCVVAAMTYARRTGREFLGMVKTGNYEEYPQDIEKTIMRNVKYADKNILSGFYCGFNENDWLCNGFPDTDIPNVLLNGYFQDLRCIDKDIAYYLFKPYDSILKEIYELYPDINDMVCVHVRRGDYLSLEGFGFNHYSREELNEIIGTHFPDDKILFVSDDINWCKENFIGEKYYFADKPCSCPVEMDLYLQTQCKGNVISNSSFSWWGAYLNERTEKVVCHWPWFNNGINSMDTLLPENWIKYNFIKTNNMIVDIVCIAKREELTICDWIEYHRQMGINHIYIFDNNDVGNQSLINKVIPYVQMGYVTVFNNVNGLKGIQLECYNGFIRENYKQRVNNWTAFIDCDEYITINSKYSTIGEFLNDVEYKCPDAGIVYLNWDTYNSNGKILYDPTPVVERFKEKAPEELRENRHIKSLVRCDCDAIFKDFPHNAYPNDGKKIYDALLREVAYSPFNEIRDDYPVTIRHYVTKSLQEYVYRKYKAGTADSLTQDPYNFDYFLKYNNNDEKYYKKHFNTLKKLIKGK